MLYGVEEVKYDTHIANSYFGLAYSISSSRPL